MSRTQSRFIEKAQTRERGNADNAATRRAVAREHEAKLNDDLQRRAAEVAPYLEKRFGLAFRGRILELDAGSGWLSAELSKLPRVVEVIATDTSGRRLKEDAPRVFEKTGALEQKITRMQGELHKLDFPDSHFDFVVCAAMLGRITNIVSALREARRVLKPGGRFVSVREPVKPLLKLGSKNIANTGNLYSRDDYERFFAAAGFAVEFKRVNLSTGMKYYFENMFNGLTHARYALVARKLSRPAGSVEVKVAKKAPR